MVTASTSQTEGDSMPRELIDQSSDVKGAHDYFSAKMAFTTGPVELTRAIANGEVNVVDVRAAKDYAEGHIPGSTSQPQSSWQDTSRLSTDHPNVLVCYSPVCHLAAHAATLFSEKGFAVMELDGGMREWREHGGAIEKQPEPAAQ
jgi:rhodanese-related sulfurtransferase